MTRADLRVGYVVEKRDEKLMLVMETSEGITLISKDGWVRLKDYDDDLKFCGSPAHDIVSVYGYSSVIIGSCDIDKANRNLLWKREQTKSELKLNDFAKEVYANAKAHGWYDDNRTFGDVVALCHSELSEALEEYRNQKPMVYYLDSDGDISTDMSAYRGQKLEGIATEMIDCIIRILDWCGANDVDVEMISKLKHEYNKTRPYKHNGKRI